MSVFSTMVSAKSAISQKDCQGRTREPEPDWKLRRSPQIGREPPRCAPARSRNEKPRAGLDRSCPDKRMHDARAKKAQARDGRAPCKFQSARRNTLRSGFEDNFGGFRQT